MASTIAVIAVTAGCAAGDDVPSGARAGDTVTTSPPTGPAPSPTSDPTLGSPAFGGGTARQTGEGSGSGLVLVDVRVAAAEGFDRVVLEFSGTGTPGWVVNYVDTAVLEGSGQAVDLDGGAVLDIYASGTTWPAPDYYQGATRLTPENGDGGGVSEVYVGGTLEGYTQVLAGVVGARAPFRVSTLTEPSRLVVDVADGADRGPARPDTDPGSPPLSPAFLPAPGELPTRERLTPWEEVATPHERLVGCQPDVAVSAEEVIARSYTAHVAAVRGASESDQVAAEIRISVLQYASTPEGEAAEAAVTGWVRDCRDPIDPALDGASRQGSVIETEAGSYGTWVYAAPETCTGDCDAVWFDQMGVLADQGRMVVVSFREAGGPVEPDGLDATMRDLMLHAAGRSMPG